MKVKKNLEIDQVRSYLDEIFGQDVHKKCQYSLADAS